MALAETVKKQIKVLVIGTDHAIQRHQDTNTELEALRVEFEKLLRQLIKEREIDLIAEEAGDDTKMYELLRQDEEATPPELEILFEGSEIVDHPVSTIAKQIADERPGELRHVDIRAPNAEKLTITERDAAMAAKVREIAGDADSIVVIVGEDHRAGVVERLKGQGMTVESMSFPNE
jgi:pheromone shutdown protein TraB